MKYISRRKLLQLGAGTVGYLTTGGRLGRLEQLAAQTAPNDPDYKALVCIFLGGGMDTNNLVVPIETSIQSFANYTNVRAGNLGLPLGGLLPIVNSTGEQYGFHSSVAGLASLYSRGSLAIISNVGTLAQPVTATAVRSGKATVPLNLYSHADQQSQWQTAQTRTVSATGWAGRTADLVQPLMNAGAIIPTSVSLSGNTLFLVGEKTSVGQLDPQLNGINGADGGSRDAAQLQILSLSDGISLIQSANRIANNSIAFAGAIIPALSSAGNLNTAFPSTPFGSQLQQIAQVIKVRQKLGVRRQIFYVTMGGYDFHSYQVSGENSFFPQLSDAMTAFYNATVEMGLDRQVVTFTESEFGRTLQPNTTGGSDHAWGSHHLVMSSALNAADIYGTFPLLNLDGPDDATGRGVWVPTTSMDQYGATLASWFGVPDTSLNTVFPNLPAFQIRNLGFV